MTLARPEQIMICNGSTQAVGIVCRVLQSQGARRIAVEDPGHTDQCTDIRRLGLATPRIPVDEHGIRVDLLERARADAVLVTPAHQYPTGAVLAPERRVALLDWAVRRNAIIIEDDYDAEYRYDRGPVGALHGLAPDHVAYVGSASKVLSPALRLGWVVVPNQLTDAVADAKLGTDRGSPVLEQLAFAEFIECGAFDRHLRRTRQTYRRRRDALMTALQSRFPNLRSRGIAAGLHVLFDLPPDVNEQDVVTTAEQQGIRLYGAAGYYANPKRGVPALVLGFGGLTESAIPEAVANLAIAIGRAARFGRARGAGRS